MTCNWPPPDWLRRLAVHLWRDCRTTNDHVRLSFSDIEAVVGQLPVSARKHRPWWANDKTHSQASAWLDVGYRVAQVDLPGEVAWFVPDGRPHLVGEEPTFSTTGDVLPAIATSRSGQSAR